MAALSTLTRTPKNLMSTRTGNSLVSILNISSMSWCIISFLNSNEMKFSNSWGNKIMYSSETYDINFTIDLFSSKNKNFEFEILNENYKVLNQGNFNTDQGFNKIKIPIVIDKKLSSKYLKKIGFKSKISDDGNRYLSKGEYILKVDNQQLRFSVK